MNELETLMVASIVSSVDQVFTTMLEARASAGEPSLHTNAPEPSDGVVSLIGLAGPWTGAGSLSCSPALACRMCSQMLMMQAEAVDDEVLDAMAELTNMVIGGVKNDLEPHTGPLGLSIPTVIYGRNFQMKGGAGAAWITVPFECDGEPLLVRLCLAPTTEGSHMRPHAPHPAYPVEA
jgi:chemotaxis protein CheX